ncbi:MAG: hypothetical protein WC993_05080 [Methanoculleus sp.]
MRWIYTGSVAGDDQGRTCGGLLPGSPVLLVLDLQALRIGWRDLRPLPAGYRRRLTLRAMEQSPDTYLVPISAIRRGDLDEAGRSFIEGFQDYYAG